MTEEKTYILSAYEREFCINMNCAEDEVSIDIAKCSSYNKYIKMMEKLREEGKARVMSEDSTHVYYKADKKLFNYLVLKHTKILSEEQRKAAGKRLKETRAKKTVKSTQD